MKKGKSMPAKEEQDRAVIVEGEITPETIKKALGVIAIIVIGWFIFQSYSVYQMGEELPLSQAVSEIKEQKIKEIKVSNSLITLKKNDGTRAYAQIKSTTSFAELLKAEGISQIDLNSNGRKYEENDASTGDAIYNILGIVLMGTVAFGVWSFVRAIQKQNATGGGISSFGKSNASVIIGKRPNTTFADVAGAKEAKEEIKEIVDFLKNPKQFFEMGARIPRGVLLVGEPGTGKTLLARAVAGEAKVPFFHTSGPEFEEMLVGAGAARVRDLFKRAKNLAPSIIFIDEIDAVARRRGMDYKSSHSEQTLNQILVEMDGFEKRDAVIVIAATNRPDVLDPAIMRPGRFDRNVRLTLPDITERLEILTVHSKNKKLASSVDMQKTAANTVGFSGADLENLLNESAILAVRAKRKEIIQEDIREATLKVSMGPRRGSMMMTQEDLKVTAYHEAGHAIVGAYLIDAEPIKSITVVPRGQALGLTLMYPDTESNNMTKAKLLARVAVDAAGRIAEELIYGKDHVSTGAVGDIEHSTKLVQLMVKHVGMSDAGFIVFDKHEDFDMMSSKDKYSEQTAQLLDSEVKKIVDAQYAIATKILTREKKLLEKLALELLKKETLNEEEFQEFVAKHGSEPVVAKPIVKALSVTDLIKAQQDQLEEN
jgi:cell division protease FtsH